MRAFIGIDLDRQLKEEIYDLQQRLKKFAVKGRWKYVDNFHLTLKFLGDIDSRQQIEIDQQMAPLATMTTPFQLQVGELGTFSGRDAIRVLWLGIAGDMQALHALRMEIDRTMGAVGFPVEKRGFTPHLTIAQDVVLSCGLDELRDHIGSFNVGAMQVDKFSLFKSEQIDNRRVYTAVSDYNLSNVPN